jgi:hypothetical protein
MRFVIFVIDDQTNSGSSNEMAAIDAFNDGLQQNGHWIYAAGIAAPKNAFLIDNTQGEEEIKNGSLFESNQFYSGFWLINADSEEQAKELAMAGSKACNRRVELRAFLGQ